MSTTDLACAVERFAEVTQGLPESALDLPWAWGAYDEEGVRFAFFRTYEELRELAARTAAERLAQGRGASTAQRILAQYHWAYRDLQAALLGLGAAEADRASAEGEWPVRRVVAHIVGADLGFFGVTKYALDRHRSGDGRPAAIPDEAWDAILGQDEASIEAVLEGPLVALWSYYRAFHERVLRELADIGEEELAVPSSYWEGYPLSLRFRLHRFDSHLRQHTVQIDKALESLGESPGEAKRLNRLIFAAWAEAEGAAIGAWEAGADLRQQAADTIAARTEEIAGILAQKLAGAHLIGRRSERGIQDSTAGDSQHSYVHHRLGADHSQSAHRSRCPKPGPARAKIGVSLLPPPSSMWPGVEVIPPSTNNVVP